MIVQNATHRASQEPLFVNDTVTRAASVASNETAWKNYKKYIDKGLVMKILACTC